jgi:hypothetical protein
MSTVFNIDWPFETKRSKNLVFVKKIAWIPLYEKKDNQIWIYLDYRISKFIYKVIKEFNKSGISFFFISPIFSNPTSKKLDFDIENIKNYLCSFIIEDFYFNFERIKFDLIENMIKYAHHQNCFESIKPIYDNMVSMNRSKYYSWGQTTSERDEIVKNRFQNLWREIMLSNLDI